MIAADKADSQWQVIDIMLRMRAAAYETPHTWQYLTLKVYRTTGPPPCYVICEGAVVEETGWVAFLRMSMANELRLRRLCAIGRVRVLD